MPPDPPTLTDPGWNVNSQSCPIQDEPEAGMCFQYKMSLKASGPGMLGIDHQHGTGKADELGTDPGVHGGQRGDSI